MKTYGVIVICVVVVIAGMIYGVIHSAAVQPDFWKSFVPGVWANIIGVSIGAIVGLPVGFAINHYVVRITEQRHHERHATEVRELLQQVSRELNVHATLLMRVSSIFSALILPQPSQQLTNPAPPLLGVDVASLILQEADGKQFIGNHSVLEIGEWRVLFQVSHYYTRVGELNRLLAWCIQDAQRPESWYRKIADMAYTVSTDRSQVDYEIQQAVARLTGSTTNG